MVSLVSVLILIEMYWVFFVNEMLTMCLLFIAFIVLKFCSCSFLAFQDFYHEAVMDIVKGSLCL